MPRSVNRARLSQPTLFQSPHLHPSFHELPQEIQEKTIRILARLLRLLTDRMLPGGQEARDE